MIACETEKKKKKQKRDEMETKKGGLFVKASLDDINGGVLRFQSMIDPKYQTSKERVKELGLVSASELISKGVRDKENIRSSYKSPRKSTSPKGKVGKSISPRSRPSSAPSSPSLLRDTFNVHTRSSSLVLSRYQLSIIDWIKSRGVELPVPTRRVLLKRSLGKPSVTISELTSADIGKYTYIIHMYIIYVFVYSIQL